MSELLDALIANNDSICRALADSTADFICLATSHGEPFYLNPRRPAHGRPGRRRADRARQACTTTTPRSRGRSCATWRCRRSIETGTGKAAAGSATVKTGELLDVQTHHVPRQAAARRHAHLPGDHASRRRASGPPLRGPGRIASPQARHPRIVARPDHHDQPRRASSPSSTGRRSRRSAIRAKRCWGRGRPTCSFRPRSAPATATASTATWRRARDRCWASGRR